jgi:cytochrome c-type biogenesis protein CcmE
MGRTQGVVEGIIMTNVRAKLIVGGSVFAAAVAYLAYAGIVAGSSYYLSVDEFTSSDKHHAKRVRLYGDVGAEGLVMGSGGDKAKFVLLGDKSRITVRYDGVVPDLFQPGGEVLVVGSLGKGGVFEANELMTKCASKYQDMKKEGKKRPQ